MTKKLILLILALPLFLMICLFTATSGVSLAVPISVSGIELKSGSFVEMDLDNPKEQHVIDYTVYPTNAANQAVTISYEPLVDGDGNEQKLAQFSYDEETHTLKPLSPGSAEVILTTVDGGFKTRFTVNVKTKQLVSIEANHPTLSSVVDEETGLKKYVLAPGEDFSLDIKHEPESASNIRVNIKSSNPEVVQVQGKKLKVNGVGRSIITVTSQANKYITDTFVVEVKNPENQSMVIVNKDVSSVESSGAIPIFIYATSDYTLDAKIVDAEGNELTDTYNYAIVRLNANHTALDYYFVEDYYGKIFVDVTLSTTLGEVTTIRCSIEKIHPSEQDKFRVEMDSEQYGIGYDQEGDIYFSVWPDDGFMDLEFEVKFSNGNVEVDGEVVPVGGIYYKFDIKSKLVGITEVTITARNKDTNETATSTATIVVKPSSIFADTPKYEGIEQSFTIGKYNADHTEENPSLYSYILKYNISDKVGEGFYENLKWTTNSDSVRVDDDGRIVFVEGADVDAEFVTFTVVFSYNGVETKSQSIRIRCVHNGYNVTNYKELLKLTNEGKVIVLQSNIIEDFGKDIENFEYPLYTEMQSTYDTTWYKNQGREAEAKVKVLISFKANVYGNGYEINANNAVTLGNVGFSDSGQPQLDLDIAIFAGPLNFVGLSDGKGNGGAVKVAAQDNICFAAFDNVTLNNVVLTGRNMISENGSYNLQQLHYAGTVVEAFGNVNIEYSRVQNGRNVIRAFGDDTPFGKASEDRDITVTIKNSVLSGARDFIMRVGSNKVVDGTAGDRNALSPYITDENPNDRVDYSMRHYYDDEKYTDDERDLYDDQFIRTFIRLENSVLKDPGIFGIGVDSHFAGTALHDGANFADFAEQSSALGYWKNLAKTSYGVKLTLSGDVRMYCWQELDKIDSSSLIETMNGFKLGLLSAETLAFDIPTLVRSAVSGNPNLVNVIYNPEVNAEVKNGKGTWMQIWNSINENGEKVMQKYDKVHAGIAFFGGGKNYSVLDYDNFDFYEFSKPYEISLADAGRHELTLAAGEEEFYFVLYDATTAYFLYEKQQEMLNNNDEAYSCLYKSNK